MRGVAGKLLRQHFRLQLCVLTIHKKFCANTIMENKKVERFIMVDRYFHHKVQQFYIDLNNHNIGT